MSELRLDAAAKKFRTLEKEVRQLRDLFEEILAGQKQIRTQLKDVERSCERKIAFAREIQDAANENHHFYIKTLNELLKAHNLPAITESEDRSRTA